MILRKGSNNGVKMLYAVVAILFITLLLFFLASLLTAAWLQGSCCT
jgi:hypothetical protein